jgi:outer membrane biosynthesis protein TonB
MKRPRPGLRPVAVSLALHLLVLVPLVAFTRIPRALEFETIRLTLVSMPAPVEATQPAAPPPAPEPEPVVEEPQPTPPPERTPERPRTERPPAPRPTPPRTPPAAEPTPGTQGLDVQTEGVEAMFPEYFANVVTQVHRYFRWTEGTSPRATIYFEILPDGSVRNIRTIRTSGNLRFDFAVQGAVEMAGNRGAFGPLPDAFAGTSLPIQLEVEPPR